MGSQTQRSLAVTSGEGGGGRGVSGLGMRCEGLRIKQATRVHRSAQRARPMLCSDYKRSMTFKAHESLHRAPATYVTPAINQTSVKKRKRRQRRAQGLGTASPTLSATAAPASPRGYVFSVLPPECPVHPPQPPSCHHSADTTAPTPTCSPCPLPSPDCPTHTALHTPPSSRHLAHPALHMPPCTPHLAHPT